MKSALLCMALIGALFIHPSLDKAEVTSAATAQQSAAGHDTDSVPAPVSLLFLGVITIALARTCRKLRGRASH